MIADFAPAFRRLASGQWPRLRRDTNAVAAIETAIVLPTLLVACLGGLEIASLMVANTRVSSIALAIADNTSRIAAGSNLASPQVREVDVNDAFTGAQQQGLDIDFQNRGRIILSSLEVNGSGGQWIHWQRCFGNLAIGSSYGRQGAGSSGNSFPGIGPSGSEITATVGGPVMVAEVVYDYQPFIFGRLIGGTQRIEYVAAFAVRDARDTSQIYNPSPAATVATCSR